MNLGRRILPLSFEIPMSTTDRYNKFREVHEVHVDLKNSYPVFILSKNFGSKVFKKINLRCRELRSLV